MKHPVRTLIHIIAVCVLLLAFSPGAVQTQSYSFSVPLLQMQVFVLPDASVRIVYDITFENYGQAIDIVDIGLPHKNYDINTMSASVDGIAVTDIRKSEYIDIGVEIHLGSQVIPSGETGTLHFECTMPDMVYQDTTNKDLASMQFTPTWFGAGLVSDAGTIQLAVHVPAGIEADEVLYQQEPFAEKVRYEDHIVVLWEWVDIYPTKAYLVGVSFPLRTMDHVVKMPLLDLTRKWLEDNPGTRFILGFIVMGLLTFIFFRFSGGTGCAIYAILAAIALVLLINTPLSIFIFIPALILMLWLNERSLKNKRQRYQPPVAAVEGGGIKRGLTAPEAAVLLGIPQNKVLALVIFGMLEKGLVEMTQDDPLKVGVTEGYITWKIQENRRELKQRHRMRRNEARKQGTVIHKYEQYFLDQLEYHSRKAIKDIDFKDAMPQLVKLTRAKMENFDLSATKDYYRRVIDRAIQQATELGEIEQREKYLDKYHPWVMMDDSYPTVFTYQGVHYWPRWARATRSRLTGSATRTSSNSASSGGRTTFGDVAASFAGWTESTMGDFAQTILPSSLNLPSTRNSMVDWDAVELVTDDAFKALRSSSGGGGRGRSRGRSCACACAGCACACACAGGGR